jgi:hypothetical protein
MTYIHVLLTNKEGIYHWDDIVSFGLMRRIGNGFVGKAYCIPIYSIESNSALPSDEIEEYFITFRNYVITYPEFSFKVIERQPTNLNLDLMVYFRKYCMLKNIIFPDLIAKNLPKIDDEPISDKFKNIRMRKLTTILKKPPVLRSIRYALNNPEIVGIEPNDKYCDFLLNFIEYLQSGQK